jgi:hypothetical protein
LIINKCDERDKRDTFSYCATANCVNLIKGCITMRNDYPNGTVVKQLFSGLEGIIIDREEYDSGQIIHYITEMRYGETIKLTPSSVLPADDPVHDKIRDWFIIGRQNGYKLMYFAKDTRTNEWIALFGMKEGDHARAREVNPNIEFYWIWEIKTV